ncbi:PaaI family thioesterase, partial [Klebsiella pneumoniae]|uniref:PaaI family thioesterase n=1 Tax=Klebsiella pneumoniae TaxID=573 RepID=UPI003851FC3E
MERGVVKVAVSLRPDLTQHHGFAHGGVVGALADTACAWAAASVVGDVVTGSYTLQFLAPARGARLAATARVIRAGRRSVSVEARIT